MKLNDTQLPNMYSKGLFNEKSYDIAPDHTDKILDVIFTATADILNATKSVERPAAFIYNSMDGEFVAGALVQYFANKDDKDSPGNWSLVWTFDDKDIPDSALKLSLDNSQCHSNFIAAAGQKYGIQFQNDAALVILTTYALMQLKKWLDENAKEGSEVSIELEGVFEARVAVEKGAKVFALAADPEIKLLIKDDAAIEK